MRRHLRSAPIGEWGVLGPRFPIAYLCSEERRYPDVVYNSQDNEYLVVWEQYDGAYFRIYGPIVSATGTLPGSEFAISTGPSLKNCYRPSVAYASTSDKYLVVWERQVVANISRDIGAQVLTGAGGARWRQLPACHGHVNVLLRVAGSILQLSRQRVSGGLGAGR